MSWFSRISSRRRAGDLEDGDLGAENGIWVGKAEGGQGPSRTARATLLPRFNGTASDQPRYDRRSPLDLARFRLRDAFTPSHPIVQPEMFAGRSKVLQTLIRAIEDQRLPRHHVRGARHRQNFAPPYPREACAGILSTLCVTHPAVRKRILTHDLPRDPARHSSPLS